MIFADDLSIKRVGSTSAHGILSWTIRRGLSTGHRSQVTGHRSQYKILNLPWVRIWFVSIYFVFFLVCILYSSLLTRLSAETTIESYWNSDSRREKNCIYYPDWQCVFLICIRIEDKAWLVFTGDGVVVGVVIRSLERDDLVKIKPTESESEHWLCLWLRRLWSSENCIVGVASRSERINQWQCSIPGLAIGWFFRFCFRLRQPSFHWIILKRRSRKRDRKKWKRSDSSDSDSVELMTPLTTLIFHFH